MGYNLKMPAISAGFFTAFSGEIDHFSRGNFESYFMSDDQRGK
jgi:hypothetical protein